MLERWVYRIQIAEADAVQARLSVINAMVARLVLELDALRDGPPSASGEEPNGGTDET